MAQTTRNTSPQSKVRKQTRKKKRVKLKCRFSSQSFSPCAEIIATQQSMVAIRHPGCWNLMWHFNILMYFFLLLRCRFGGSAAAGRWEKRGALWEDNIQPLITTSSARVLPRTQNESLWLPFKGGAEIKYKSRLWIRRSGGASETAGDSDEPQPPSCPRCPRRHLHFVSEQPQSRQSCD